MGKKKPNSDSDEDDIFYYRYSSSSAATTSNPNDKSGGGGGGGGGGSGGLAPSKSTIYVSNLDYSLTNSDLHTLFSTFGKIARVTVLKDRISRQSRGVAFVQYVSRDDALSATRQMDRKILNGRTISASIASDNGRAPEFIKKRVYRDKSRCYECGEAGHLSYECPKNQLGSRERPVTPKRRGGGGVYQGRREEGGDGHGDENGIEFEEENWASVVDNGADERLLLRSGEEREEEVQRKKMKKSSYFSDESDDED